MNSITIRSPRELNLPKSIRFWYPRTNPRNFKIDHIIIRPTNNPDNVWVELYDCPDGPMKEKWCTRFGAGTIKTLKLSTQRKPQPVPATSPKPIRRKPSPVRTFF